ncbi:uncharacterized protein BT62DRAFT_922629 [Guyanagaster necrorhizus]|uniref:Uncharacterized protein n=1 Tax=Guyanagaster necrorhizus TaxID=856835 RepID=A0A9P8AQ30_9AGAR|nr:uncharacterized protein BT62DRAFT_922629 [Guyanagaster necrorhizus MCA 3950]KAG7442447.1 hypothetical protein BT62DRAFT_922629 [Guyanagaster necrorhizus MCA 3950]
MMLPALKEEKRLKRVEWNGQFQDSGELKGIISLYSGASFSKKDVICSPGYKCSKSLQHPGAIKFLDELGGNETPFRPLVVSHEGYLLAPSKGWRPPHRWQQGPARTPKQNLNWTERENAELSAKTSSAAVTRKRDFTTIDMRLETPSLQGDLSFSSFTGNRLLFTTGRMARRNREDAHTTGTINDGAATASLECWVYLPTCIGQRIYI